MLRKESVRQRIALSLRPRGLLVLGVFKVKFMLCIVLASEISISARAAEITPQQRTIIEYGATMICDGVRYAKGQMTGLPIEPGIKADVGVVVEQLAEAGAFENWSTDPSILESFTQDANAVPFEGDQGCQQRIFDRMLSRLSASTATISPMGTKRSRWISLDNIGPAVHPLESVWIVDGQMPKAENIFYDILTLKKDEFDKLAMPIIDHLRGRHFSRNLYQRGDPPYTVAGEIAFGTTRVWTHTGFGRDETHVIERDESCALIRSFLNLSSGRVFSPFNAGVAGFYKDIGCEDKR